MPHAEAVGAGPQEPGSRCLGRHVSGTPPVGLFVEVAEALPGGPHLGSGRSGSPLGRADNALRVPAQALGELRDPGSHAPQQGGSDRARPDPLHHRHILLEPGGDQHRPRRVDRREPVRTGHDPGLDTQPPGLVPGAPGHEGGEGSPARHYGQAGDAEAGAQPDRSHQVTGRRRHDLHHPRTGEVVGRAPMVPEHLPRPVHRG